MAGTGGGGVESFLAGTLALPFPLLAGPGVAVEAAARADLRLGVSSSVVASTAEASAASERLDERREAVPGVAAAYAELEGVTAAASDLRGVRARAGVETEAAEDEATTDLRGRPGPRRLGVSETSASLVKPSVSSPTSSRGLRGAGEPLCDLRRAFCCLTTSSRCSLTASLTSLASLRVSGKRSSPRSSAQCVVLRSSGETSCPMIKSATARAQRQHSSEHTAVYQRLTLPVVRVVLAENGDMARDLGAVADLARLAADVLAEEAVATVRLVVILEPDRAAAHVGQERHACETRREGQRGATGAGARADGHAPAYRTLSSSASHNSPPPSSFLPLFALLGELSSPAPGAIEALPRFKGVAAAADDEAIDDSRVRRDARVLSGDVDGASVELARASRV